jgi:hypothetical protein
VAERGQCQLPHVITALHPPGGSPGRLHRRQKQPDEQANDGDHGQKFDERKTV